MNGEAWVVRFCILCGDQTRDYPSAKSPQCFSCGNAKNPYAAKNIRMSVDAAGEDSTNPARIADGTDKYNMALPDVPGEVIGKDAYGMTKRRMRPVLNSEIASTRQLREMGKRAGLRLLETPKRAIG
jgi:hypothetical protein